MDRQVSVECGSCRKHVSADVLSQCDQVNEADPSFTHHVILARCPACASAIVVGQATEWWGSYLEGEYSTSTPIRLWPSPPRLLSTDAPEGVRRDFEEAQRCMSIDAHTGAAMLARRVLEGIAVDLGATEFALGKKLGELKDSGAIDGRLLEWAQALQVVGNDAAHDVKSVVSREDAADALAFAEALADYVYTFRNRYKQFLSRRSASAGNGTPASDTQPPSI